MHLKYTAMRNTYMHMFMSVGREESSKSKEDKKFVTYTIAETARQ